MKILQLAARLPYPLTDGGAIGIFHLARSLSENGNEVTFVSFPLVDPVQTHEAVSAMSEFCEVRLVTKPLPSRARTLFRTLFKGAYPIERRMMPEMFALLEELITNEKFDIVHLDHSHVGKYGLWIKERFDLPVVLRQHNFENQIYKRFVEHESNPLKRYLARVHGDRLEREEVLILEGMDAVVAITSEDAALMQEAAPGVRYEVVPAGVDTDYFLPSSQEHEQDHRLLWIGGMSWEPNRDALEFFLKDIFPLVLGRNASIVFDVVGAGTETLRGQTACFGKAVYLHGQIPDIRVFFPEAAVLVVPLRIGGGMRVKLLEFFAAGKAVVTTSIGAEGNLARDGIECLVRNTASDFADAIVKLMDDRKQRALLGANARALVAREYGWSRIGKRLTDIYLSILHANRKKDES